MNARFALAAAALLAAFPVFAQEFPDGLTAKQIADKVLDNDSLGFSNGQATITLTIQNKRGQERVRKLETKSMKVDGLQWTLATFLEPADVAGTKLLAKEVKDGSDLQYLYLPALKEKRRIAGSEKNESFMGTDFTYYDLEQRGIEDAEYTRLPDEKQSDIDCFRIESRGKDKDSPYSKLDMWVDKKDYLPLKIYFYDKSGEHVKTLVAQMVEPKGGIMTITKLMMKNVQKGSKTTMSMEQIDRTRTFPKSIFDENSFDK
jgi:hypothetical protein